MLRRIDFVLPAGEHGDGAGREARAMGGGVDAARETRHHAEARGAELAGESLRHLHPRRGSVARADHGDQGAVQHRGIAADREEGRGIVDDLEMRRIVGLAERDEAGADACGGRDLLLGLLAAANAQRPRRAAAPLWT
jgi:hypothetical protein